MEKIPLPVPQKGNKRYEGCGPHSGMSVTKIGRERESQGSCSTIYKKQTNNLTVNKLLLFR